MVVELVFCVEAGRTVRTCQQIPPLTVCGTDLSGRKWRERQRTRRKEKLCQRTELINDGIFPRMLLESDVSTDLWVFSGCGEAVDVTGLRPRRRRDCVEM